MNTTIEFEADDHCGQYTIGSCLVLGEFGTGAVITEDFLAQQFGQSITMVRCDCSW